MKQFLVLGVMLAVNFISSAQTQKIDSKAVHKNLGKISETLYASKFEVSNLQYNEFLTYLKRNQREEDFNIAQIDSSQWVETLTYGEPYVMFYHSHPAYMGYPVVNISHEGAVLFCDWLTEVYNSNKKRKFEQVKFRLPTKEEWIMAAKAGDPNAIYPWPGNDIRNEKGVYCFNGTLDKSEYQGKPGKLSDNADVTAPVKSYWPNDFGLYNMGGNVAEMLAEKGQTKGGSWRDQAEQMKIESESQTEFNAPSPSVGFRYFMEIIEL